MKRGLKSALEAIAVFVAWGVLGCAFADAVGINFPPERFERTFGDVRIEAGAPRQPDGLPDWPSLHVNGKKIAAYPSLLAQEIVASPDETYFLLLSNLGLSSFAAAVIDRDGKILLSKPHNAKPLEGDLHYCRMSVTNVREWVNLKDANARFAVGGDGRLKSVTVKGCDGGDIVLDRRE